VLFGSELHVNNLDFFKHCFLTVALRTKATQFSNASSCSTSPGSSPVDSEDEDDAAEAWSDDSDDDECLPGRPLWGTYSFNTYANDVQNREEAAEEEDEGLPGWVPWSEQSFEDHKRLPSRPSWSKQSLEEQEEEDGLPGWALWSGMEEQEEEDGLTGWALWSDLSFQRSCQDPCRRQLDDSGVR